MTAADFTAFYPQFAGFTPAVVLAEYIRQANARFSSFSPEDAEEARRLYTAHKLTMYARVALPDNTIPSKSAIAAAGEENVYSLKDFGNKPAGRFILRNAKWIDMLPAEFEAMMKQGGAQNG